jgi:uncharacterized membrane protein
LSHRQEAERWAEIQNLLRSSSVCSEAVKRFEARISLMADFLVVVGIVAFALVMLGLVWALERV